MVGPFMADAEKLAAVREGLPSVSAGIYLNTPVAGPLPAETAQAMADIAGWEVKTGRASRDRADEVGVRIDEARAAIAAILGGDVDAIELVHGVADGVRRGLASIQWRDGDQALVIGQPGTELIVDVVATASSGRYEAIPLTPPPDPADDTDDQLVAAFADAIQGVRLVALPHVTSTGRRLPVGRLVAVAHDAGALAIVDGSQAAGAIPVSIEDLGADFYVVPGWRWLLGPEGIGAVAIGRGGTAASSAEPAAGLTLGEFHLPSVVGLARSCGWLSMYIGLEWIHRRSAELARAAAERLAATPGVTLLAPQDLLATTIAFRIDGWSAPDALDELGARIFALASVVPESDAIRIGTGFFNTEDELERFAGGVELLASHPPGTLPPRRQLTIIGGER